RPPRNGGSRKPRHGVPAARLGLPAHGPEALLPELLPRRGPARPRAWDALPRARARAGAGSRRRRGGVVDGEPVAPGDLPERRAARRRLLACPHSFAASAGDAARRTGRAPRPPRRGCAAPAALQAAGAG